MAFRADEAADDGRRRAYRILAPEFAGLDREVARLSKETIDHLIEDLGPVVELYPTWHPVVARPWLYAADNDRLQETIRSPEQAGFAGLDHTVFFTGGFVTCPYGDKWKDVIASVEARPDHPYARLKAFRIPDVLYSPDTAPVVVKCLCHRDLNADETVPFRMAAPLLLQEELRWCLSAEVGETWETMAPYFLGTPRGQVSSLFVNQRTGQAMKKLWNHVSKAGLFGPIYNQL